MYKAELAQVFRHLRQLSSANIIPPALQNLQLHATLTRTNRRSSAVSRIGEGGIKRKVTLVSRFYLCQNLGWLQALTVEVPLQLRLILCHICGEESNIWTCLSQSNSFSPIKHIQQVHHIHFYLHSPPVRRTSGRRVGAFTDSNYLPEIGSTVINPTTVPFTYS